MFGKLLSRFQQKKSDHPLGTAENLAGLVADIPTGDPGRLLTDVDHWLGGLEGALAELGPDRVLTAIVRLDDHSWPAIDLLLGRFISPGSRDFLSDGVWTTLDIHAGYLLDGYRLILEAAGAAREPIAEKPALASVATRGLRAWALKKKLLRFRYREAGEALWSAAHQMLKLAGAMDLLQYRTMPYSGEEDSTPLREYLLGLYLELAPLGNLVPQQVEMVARFLRHIENLEFASRPVETSTHMVDLAGTAGLRRRTDEQGGSGLRFLSAVRLRNRVMQLAATATKGGILPDWIVSLRLNAEQLNGALLALVAHWAPAPPQRGADRIAQAEDLKVVLGFGLARRMVAYSLFARMGRQMVYEGGEFEKFYEERFGRVDTAGTDAVADAEPAGVPEVASPVEILDRLETPGDREQMEAWRQVDGSSGGLGVSLPAILPRHRIGSLVALRYAVGIEWHLALIRRIGRDVHGKPNAGLHLLEWPSLPALARLDGDVTAWSATIEGGHGWVDAILVSHAGSELILPANAFAADRQLRLRSEEGSWLLRMTRLLERGIDYDRIEFERIS